MFWFWEWRGSFLLFDEGLVEEVLIGRSRVGIVFGDEFGEVQCRAKERERSALDWTQPAVAGGDAQVVVANAAGAEVVQKGVLRRGDLWLGLMQRAPGGGGLLDGRWLAVGRVDSGRVYRVETLVLQLPLQALDVCAQAGVLALEVLGMATRAREAGDAVGGAALGVVLRAGRAAAGLGVAADLPELREGWVLARCGNGYDIHVGTRRHRYRYIYGGGVVPCTCRTPGQSGWRRPSCARSRSAAAGDGGAAGAGRHTRPAGRGARPSQALGGGRPHRRRRRPRVSSLAWRRPGWWYCGGVWKRKSTEVSDASLQRAGCWRILYKRLSSQLRGEAPTALLGRH